MDAGLNELLNLNDRHLDSSRQGDTFRDGSFYGREASASTAGCPLSVVRGPLFRWVFRSEDASYRRRV